MVDNLLAFSTIVGLDKLQKSASNVKASFGAELVKIIFQVDMWLLPLGRYGNSACKAPTVDKPRVMTSKFWHM